MFLPPLDDNVVEYFSSEEKMKKRQEELREDYRFYAKVLRILITNHSGLVLIKSCQHQLNNIELNYQNLTLIPIHNGKRVENDLLTGTKNKK